MASAYLIIYFISYMPVILYLAMSKIIFKNPDIQITGIIRILTYLAQDVIMISNGISFVLKNRQCFRYYRQKILDIRQSKAKRNDVCPAME